MLLFLHGAGERGDRLDLVARHGPWRADGARGFLIVAPQCPSQRTWPEVALIAKLESLLDHVLAVYPVDSRRVYLSGLSMGAFGTWAWAAHAPHRFAAIAPLCGAFTTPVPGRLTLARMLRLAQAQVSAAGVVDLLRLPVKIFHGRLDRTVPIAASQRVYQAIGGDTNPMADLVVLEYRGHAIWRIVYASSDLYAWFLQHST